MQFLIIPLGHGDFLVINELVEHLDARQEISRDVFLAGCIANVGRELADKIELSSSSRRCFFKALTKGEGERPMISDDIAASTFDHVSKVADALIHGC